MLVCETDEGWDDPAICVDDGDLEKDECPFGCLNDLKKIWVQKWECGCPQGGGEEEMDTGNLVMRRIFHMSHTTKRCSP